MAETHPAGESPRSDWEIGKAMNGLFGGPADDGLAADAAPDEDQAADDEVVRAAAHLPERALVVADDEVAEPVGGAAGADGFRHRAGEQQLG